ncbi:uncharacterized protein PHALS_07148 [Plasmopara halstedii]|uniref:Uncharacterized protein n=1 Tax=Plasmopara halstedii TaxID=4781 RepID=A0A0P1B3P9_PLAHL|nr:uncharacterized protein PHALS_07148 [Plasmopara halstedii]CEG49383.1 hypothetical protein PHALS_07148 [Plasmopara halstedii]|eukprot:XP_024585752.1 hypothetical protein PHALS_07148 [Plasmopara halstedii]
MCHSEVRLDSLTMHESLRHRLVYFIALDPEGTHKDRRIQELEITFAQVLERWSRKMFTGYLLRITTNCRSTGYLSVLVA